MEFQPQSENGKRLSTFMANWIEKSPKLAVDELKRMFLMCSSKLKNEETFITALYGQRVLDESPSVLSQRLPSTLLRVQHVMETSLNKGCEKKLVVALELSENESLLVEILNWTNKNAKEIQEQELIQSVSSVDQAPVKVQKANEIQEHFEAVKSLSSIDLAPVKIQKGKLLPEIMSEAVAARHREIMWTGKKKCSALEAYKHKIVVGWDNGQIGIYNSADLNCQMGLIFRLPPRAFSVSVTCLQYTGTEVIAGYSNGNMSVWDIQAEAVVQTLRPAYHRDDQWKAFPACMRWRAPQLISVTDNGSICIWQYASSSFAKSGGWYMGEKGIRDVDFNEHYVILGPSYFSGQSVRVYYKNGQHFRSISSSKGIIRMAFHANHLITSDLDGTLQIWNIGNGYCF